MDDHRAIGARILQARRAKGLTQVELAVAIGVSRAHLTNAEIGKVGLALDKLSRLAAETDTTVAWLIGESGPTDPLEIELLAAFRAIDRRDRESVVRITQTFKREEPPPDPLPGPEPPLVPFPGRGNVQKKPAHSLNGIGCEGSPTVMAV